MRRSIQALFLSVFLVPFAAAQSKKTEASNLHDHPFQVDYPSGSQLSLHLRSGDFTVAGSNDSKITVRVEGSNLEGARKVTVSFERFDNSAELRVWGGARNLDNVHVTVEVPRSTGLFVRMPAGDLEIKNTVGDKDVQLHAGDLTVEVGNPSDYSHVDVSVTTGDIDAEPFGENHGGLFRSFHKEGNGKYKLHAHVGAGDLRLR